jgi:hypothetical protein
MKENHPVTAPTVLTIDHFKRKKPKTDVISPKYIASSDHESKSGFVTRVHKDDRHVYSPNT